jgi:integrase
MATGKFRIKTSNDWNTVFYRFKQGNVFDCETSIGIQIPKGRWSDSKQEVLMTKDINYTDVNVKLKGFDAFIRKEYESSKVSDNTILINTKWLKNKIDAFFNRVSGSNEIDDKVFMTNFIRSFIEDSKTKRNRKGTPLKPRTIEHYNTTLNKIITFEKFVGVKLKLTEIDLTFHNAFISYLEKEQKLNQNTIGGYIDDLKLFCGNADKKGLSVSKEFKLTEFYSPSNKTKDIYLKEYEIDLVYNTIFEQDYLDNARDWFIIGLRTGLRISDFLKLTTENIDEEFIYKETLKTDFPVIIPIHHQVQEILKKRNGNFPRPISDQKFNVYVKEVAKNSGLNEKTEGAKMCDIEITENGKKNVVSRKQFGVFPKYELVSSHICRRTFATNLYGKIDTLTIMKITAHKTEKQFLDYIKITPLEYAEKLKTYWKNANLISENN